MIFFAICIACALLGFIATALYTVYELCRGVVRLVRALLPTLLVLVVLCAGCAHPIDTAIVSLNAARVTLATTEEIVAKEERSKRDHAIAISHDAADAKAHVEAVYAAYRSTWDSYHDARMRFVALYNLVTALKMQDATGKALDAAALAQALNGIDDLAAMLKALYMTIETDIKVSAP